MQAWIAALVSIIANNGSPYRQRKTVSLCAELRSKENRTFPAGAHFCSISVDAHSSPAPIYACHYFYLPPSTEGM